MADLTDIHCSSAYHDGILYRVGDLIEAAKACEVDVIFHQANCQSLMKSGIAGAIVAQYPEVAEVDRQSIMTPMDKLGKFTAVETFDGFAVYNLYGQYNPGADTRYSALRSALVCAVRDVRQKYGSDVEVGIPLLGCGIGGGDWKVVSKIIKEVFQNTNFVVYVLDETTLLEITK